MNKYVPDELKDLSNSQQRVMRNVVNHLENKNNKQPGRKWQVGVMTAIVTAVALFFLLQLPLQNDEKASVQPEVFFDIKVKEILIAKSKSETSFQASSMSNMHTIKIDNDVDVTFKTEVEQLFKNLKSLSTPPTYNTPAYDMKVSQEVGNPLKIKIWESEGNIYLYNMTEDKFYTSFHRSAFNVYSMMKNIPPLQ